LPWRTVLTPQSLCVLQRRQYPVGDYCITGKSISNRRLVYYDLQAGSWGWLFKSSLVTCRGGNILGRPHYRLHSLLLLSSSALTLLVGRRGRNVYFCQPTNMKRQSRGGSMRGQGCQRPPVKFLPPPLCGPKKFKIRPPLAKIFYIT